ncbi:MAG TPA: hypothetical protein VGJ48_05320 [Pyrinomonadaceae bacterium]|jgi:hypothetical protein
MIINIADIDTAVSDVLSVRPENSACLGNRSLQRIKGSAYFFIRWTLLVIGLDLGPGDFSLSEYYRMARVNQKRCLPRYYDPRWEWRRKTLVARRAGLWPPECDSWLCHNPIVRFKLEGLLL